MSMIYTALGSVTVALGTAADAADASGSAFARVAHAVSTLGDAVTAIGTSSDAAAADLTTGTAFAQIKYVDSRITTAVSDASSAATTAAQSALAAAGLSTTITIFTVDTDAEAALVNPATAHDYNVMNFNAGTALVLNFDGAAVVGTWFRLFNKGTANVSLTVPGIANHLQVLPNTGVRAVCIEVDSGTPMDWIVIDGM